MAEFVPASSVTACPIGGLQRVRVRDLDLLLVNVDGQFYALNNLCTHEEVPLHLGCVHGKTVRCSLHGSRFDVTTGEPQEEPATEAVRTYAVKVEDGQVWVEI